MALRMLCGRPGCVQGAHGLSGCATDSLQAQLLHLHNPRIVDILRLQIRRKQETEALAYGRDVLASACSTKADEELFQARPKTTRYWLSVPPHMNDTSAADLSAASQQRPRPLHHITVNGPSVLLAAIP